MTADPPLGETPAAASYAADRRQAPRQRVLRSGKLAFGTDLTSDCAIREESEGGARLLVGEHLIPRKVVLVALSQGLAYEARLVWRRGREAGVKFLNTYPMTPKAKIEVPEGVHRARRLWAEDVRRTPVE